MWVSAPKFHVGQEGIWILQAQKMERTTPELGSVAYTALDPEDFRPKSEMVRIRRLTVSK